MDYAPILVSVYNRNIHFKKCIESLKNNQLIDKSHLFIAIDAPFKEEDKTNNKKIIDYAKSIKGFKEITLFIRNKNIGGYENRQLARKDIFRIYDKLIMFEDDNIFSPDFLSFVNKGLNVYNYREDIFSISGYNSPIKIPKHYSYDIYLRPGFTAWGVGIWKNKWEKVNNTLDKFESFAKNKKQLKAYAKKDEKAILHIRKLLKSGPIISDGFLGIHMYLNNMYSIYPVSTRVLNIGHDSSGQRCGTNQKFLTQIFENDIKEAKFPPDIKIDDKILKVIRKYRSFTVSKKLKMQILELFRLVQNKYSINKL